LGLCRWYAQVLPFPRKILLADTDVLKNYRVGDAPTLPNSDKLYLSEQLKQISQAVNLLVQVAKKLEARMAAHGF
jgi:hypothetical protein